MALDMMEKELIRNSEKELYNKVLYKKTKPLTN